MSNPIDPNKAADSFGPIDPFNAIDSFHAIEEGQALRSGLKALYQPVLSPDFESHILTALAKPQPWWRILWDSTRPVLVSAGCSLTVTLALVAVISHLPVSHAIDDTPNFHPISAIALDHILEEPNLRANSLTQPLLKEQKPAAKPRRWENPFAVFQHFGPTQSSMQSGSLTA